jgi:capping protein alpha
MAVSDAEMVKIANSFLLNAPPGEFNEVVSDVRGLLQNDDILNQNAQETFRTYNTTQMIQIKNGDHEALICKYGEIGHNEYLDPLGGQIITFDHIRQKIVSTRNIGGELDSGAEPFRKAIEDHGLRYLAEHYQNGTAAAFSAKEGSEFKITFCISSSKFSPTNFWGGRWRSVWTIKFKPGGDAKLEGIVRIQVHYYEDGNVQLVTNFSKPATVKIPSDAKGAAEALLKQIAKAEQEYHTALEHSYNTMSETTFKALRRVLPITREKIKWEKIRNYRIGSEAAGK